jgi:membrane protein DedA with SNARE-associated domain
MIEALNALLSTYGLWLVFLVVLIDQGGIPIPAWPLLVVASAQAMERQEPVWPILLAATVAVRACCG